MVNNITDFNQGHLDSTLRPSSWDDYIGQTHIKQNLEILLKAANKRGHTPEHLLFYGPPGLGKTTLAHLIAKETGRNLKTTSGPAIEKIGDLASILTNTTAGDIIFIDEIHRLNKMIEEVLYPAMESGTLDIMIGKGPSARSIQLELPPFTLIAATTRVALLSAPLRSRFSGGVFRLHYYNDEELSRILKRTATILNVPFSNSSLMEIAKRSRATPRTANYLMKRIRDYAEVHNQDISDDLVQKALLLLGIDNFGLNQTDRLLLDTLENKLNGGPAGLKTLSASTGEEEEAIEDVLEPYLIQIGFIERTPKGRILTEKGRDHILSCEKLFSL